MIVIELGKFIVHERTRFDNPAWPVYFVFLRGKLVGKSFSRPDLGCCEWLEQQHRVDCLVYAEQSARLTEHSIQSLGCHRRAGPGRPRITILVEEESN